MKSYPSKSQKTDGFSSGNTGRFYVINNRNSKRNTDWKIIEINKPYGN